MSLPLDGIRVIGLGQIFAVPELEGVPTGRLGNRHRNACPSNIYPCRDGDPRPVVPPPALGEHTAEVLATVGVDAAALASLRARGIV